MYLGLDLGSSALKALLLSDSGKAGEPVQVLDIESVAIGTQRPQPLWVEQQPEEWWQATQSAIQALGQRHDLSKLASVGLSGHMHGAVLLDVAGNVIPALLYRRLYA